VSGSVSIAVYVVRCIVFLRGRFGGLSSAPVAIGGVGRTCDGYWFRSVLGKLRAWFRCVPELYLADRMPWGTTWHLRPLRFPTRGVGCLCELACGSLDMVQC